MHAERVIQDALNAAEDPAGAFLWRRLCRDLDGDLRIGVVAREEALTGRALRSLQAVDGVELVPLRVEPAGEALRPTLGAVDRLLSVHALVWVTPASAALGAEERAGLGALVDAGAPSRRAVWVGDTDLLERMADDPERELAEVVTRASAVAGPGWDVTTGEAVGAWMRSLRADRERVARERRRAVAAVLLRDARMRAEQAARAAEADVSRLDALRVAEDEQLDAERRKGRRTAAHLLGAMRRHTEQLLVDLRGFLNRLEADLPAQIEAVSDIGVARATLPHWLHHVVERWMGDRLAGWRAEVLTDLAELDLDPNDLSRADLLVPSVSAAPLGADRGWGVRLTTTAVMASGAALLLYGLWIPGVVALGGGLVWSALGRRAAEAGSRRALVDAAIQAVRQMGLEADRLLRDQIVALETELSQLGEERASELARARQEQRLHLEQDRRARELRRVELLSVCAELDRRIASLATEFT